jgi:hypothetical protein
MTDDIDAVLARVREFCTGGPYYNGVSLDLRALIEHIEMQCARIDELERWKTREDETQAALQAIGEEFGVRGGEPRTDGVRRVLAEQRARIADLERQNSDLLGCNTAYRERAQKAERERDEARGQLRNIVRAWRDSGPMGTAYSMNRAVSMVPDTLLAKQEQTDGEPTQAQIGAAWALLDKPVNHLPGTDAVRLVTKDDVVAILAAARADTARRCVEIVREIGKDWRETAIAIFTVIGLVACGMGFYFVGRGAEQRRCLDISAAEARDDGTAQRIASAIRSAP